MGIDSIVPMLIKVGPPELRDLVMDEAGRATLVDRSGLLRAGRRVGPGVAADAGRPG